MVRNKKAFKAGCSTPGILLRLACRQKCSFEKKKLPERAHISTIPLKIMLAKRASSHTLLQRKNQPISCCVGPESDDPEDPNSPTTSTGYPSHKLRSMFLISKKKQWPLLGVGMFFFDLMNSHKVFFGGISRKVEAIHI